VDCDDERKHLSTVLIEVHKSSKWMCCNMYLSCISIFDPFGWQNISATVDDTSVISGTNFASSLCRNLEMGLVCPTMMWTILALHCTSHAIYNRMDLCWFSNNTISGHSDRHQCTNQFSHLHMVNSLWHTTITHSKPPIFVMGTSITCFPVIIQGQLRIRQLPHQTVMMELKTICK
jgi:hypothetical protein